MRWVWGAGIAVAVLLVAGVMWEPLTARQVAAPPARAYSAEIVRDGFGVPHIMGRTDADAAYGLAYAHAEDDFGTIEEVVAMTRARTGALNGSDGAKIDYVAHLLDIRGTVRRHYATIPGDVRAVMDGYAAGLNKYADAHPDEVRLARLFPVNGEDIAAGFVLRAPFFFGLDNVIGKLAEGKALPDDEAPTPVTPVGSAPEANGSNAFAVAPERMADGKTWLISNSHQPYEGSVAWYEAVVHSGDGMDMAGALFPGSPFVLLGHNRDLGWTNTVNRPDLIDTYKLVLNEAGDQYRFGGKWLPLEKKRVWLGVKFGPFKLPVPQTVYRSIHGPVIVNDNGAFAVRYAGIDSVKALEQYFRNTKARNWDEWTASMSLGGIPATNFIYADKEGRIALVYNALFPDRAAGYDYGRTLPGDDPKALWSESVGFDRFPKLVDPASGFVQNANNAPFLAAGPGSELDPEAFSPLLGIETNVTNRGTQAVKLLAADPLLTPAELLTIKFDTGYAKDGWLGPVMADLLAADLRDDARLARAQALLREWDWTSDGKGRADGFAERVIRIYMVARWNRAPLPTPREVLKTASDEFTERFGRIDVPLFEVQRLRRGNVDLPMDGGTDALRATSRWDKDEPDGKGRVMHGDSFTMLINWDKAGKVWSQSIQPYGAATNRPSSPHYTDQMKLFTEKRFKPVHFEWADAVKNAKRRYKV